MKKKEKEMGGNKIGGKKLVEKSTHVKQKLDQ